MTVGELREIIKTVSDDTKIEINSVWNKDTQELTSVGCDGFYHTTNNKIYLTPDVIAL